MRVLICGSRDWTDSLPITSVLDGLLFLHNCGFGTLTLDPMVIIEGGATGADEIAAAWAETWKDREPYDFGVPRLTHEQYPADWKRYGRSAGPIRNQAMLETKPSVAFAFVTMPMPESRGTADMVRRLKEAGVPTYVVQRV